MSRPATIPATSTALTCRRSGSNQLVNQLPPFPSNPASGMTVMTVLPASGVVLSDARDGGRWLRVNWHAAESMFVFSIWRDDVCAASFQLTRQGSSELISSLVRSLSEPEARPWSPAQLSNPKLGLRSRVVAAIRRSLAPISSGRSADKHP